MLPKDTEISPKILSKCSSKSCKWHPRTPSGALPQNGNIISHFGAIMELIWEQLLLILGTFFNKNQLQNRAGFLTHFFWILGGIQRDPICNPIETARSKHVFNLLGKVIFFFSFLTSFQLPGFPGFGKFWKVLEGFSRLGNVPPEALRTLRVL